MSKTHNGPRIRSDFESYVDKNVIKASGKPFKSGLLVGTVHSVGVNPYTGKPGFFFYNDDSIVDCYICKAAQAE
jgi:hypothetical protein